MTIQSQFHLCTRTETTREKSCTIHWNSNWIKRETIDGFRVRQKFEQKIANLEFSCATNHYYVIVHFMALIFCFHSSLCALWERKYFLVFHFVLIIFGRLSHTHMRRKCSQSNSTHNRNNKMNANIHIVDG